MKSKVYDSNPVSESLNVFGLICSTRFYMHTQSFQLLLIVAIDCLWFNHISGIGSSRFGWLGTRFQWIIDNFKPKVDFITARICSAIEIYNQNYVQDLASNSELSNTMNTEHPETFGIKTIVQFLLLNKASNSLYIQFLQ